MSDTDAVRVGDWVRFFRNGELVIGAVEYIRPRKSWESGDAIVTTVGTISATEILEMRRGD